MSEVTPPMFYVGEDGRVHERHGWRKCGLCWGSVWSRPNAWRCFQCGYPFLLGWLRRLLFGQKRPPTGAGSKGGNCGA